MAVNKIFPPIQMLLRPLLRYIFRNEMPCFADSFRIFSVVGAFSPLMTNFYCQEIQLIFSLKFSFLYFSSLLLITKQNNPLPLWSLHLSNICKPLSPPALGYHFAKGKAPFSLPKSAVLLCCSAFLSKIRVHIF